MKSRSPRTQKLTEPDVDNELPEGGLWMNYSNDGFTVWNYHDTRRPWATKPNQYVLLGETL